MKMGGHQTKGVNAKGKKFGVLGNIVEKLSLVPNIKKGNVPRIGSGQDMVEAKGQVNSSRSSHKSISQI
jgi:hypothetical protein